MAEQRLIDANAFKENMFKYAAPEMVWDMADIIHKIDEMPSAQPEPQWIPCSERLPEKEGRYLVWAAISFIPDHVDDPDMYHGTTIASYFEQFGRHHWYGAHVEEVIAWMPLPEPYKEEQ